jgi:hypothetical protein
VRIVSVAYRLRRRGRAGCSATAKADTRVAIRVKGVPLLGEADRCPPIGQIHRCCSGRAWVTAAGSWPRWAASPARLPNAVGQLCPRSAAASWLSQGRRAGANLQDAELAVLAIIARPPTIGWRGRRRAASVRQCWTATARARSDPICRARANVATSGLRFATDVATSGLSCESLPGFGVV